jgi:hypothetical protein
LANGEDNSMTLHHDLDKGWVTSDGEPKWRASSTAVRRLEGREVKWTNFPRRAYVGVAEGKVVSHIKRYPVANKWTARIDGFEFWHYNRVLRQEMYVPVRAFDRVADAKRFVKAVMKQVGAIA